MAKNNERPERSIWVAQTECCGLKIHNPNDLGGLCHARRAEDSHLPQNDSYPSCKILGYWRYNAQRDRLTIIQARVQEKQESVS